MGADVVSEQTMRKSLAELAAECHELAVKRGKYPIDWTPEVGMGDISGELFELMAAHVYEVACGPDDHLRQLAVNEAGDALAALLSVTHQMGIDPDEALAGAIRRNRARVPREHGGEREP